LRFPEFKEEWKSSIIGDLFDLYSGNTPSRLNKNSFTGNVNWITSGELKNHYIGDTIEKLTIESAKECKLKILPIGTFVMAIYGLEAEGVRSTCSITTQPSTISQACMAFTPKDCVNNEFLYSWYKKHGNIIGLRYAQGTKQQNLSYDILEKFELAYPTNIKEQQKLIDFVALLDKRIEIQKSVIEKLKSLMAGIRKYAQSLNSCKSTFLRDILTERKEKNLSLYPVYSVAVKEGIINQIEHLGRSFAAKDTTNYQVVHEDDIVYTKSPTGAFPYGIVKKSFTNLPVAVSPLYGVYIPKNKDIACFLHYYFLSPINTNNYLHCLIQKGAKNTINITNQHFLDNTIDLPGSEDLHKIVKGILAIQNKIGIESNILKNYLDQKSYLLSKMFI